MSGILAGERATIVAALTGDYEKHPYVPDRLVPPAAIVAPGDPYLEHRDTDTFGTHTASFEVWLVQRTGSNETVTTALDDEIEAQVEALTGAGFAVERVSEPFMYQVQNAQYLTVILYVTSNVTIP